MGYEKVFYEKQAVILARLKTMESEIGKELSELQEMLGRGWQ